MEGGRRTPMTLQLLRELSTESPQLIFLSSNRKQKGKEKGQKLRRKNGDFRFGEGKQRRWIKKAEGEEEEGGFIGERREESGH
ncbi:unnamed protein product [Linum trigynum]|uniref:Uncharacterized protein n=1 Tax=Linum trigynum TaxID=586398 RepID=A0AAV2G4R8_9ROSI